MNLGLWGDLAVAASAASLAILQAARLSSRVWSESPKSAKATDVAPNVLVSTISAPASRNEAWI